MPGGDDALKKKYKNKQTKNIILISKTNTKPFQLKREGEGGGGA